MADLKYILGENEIEEDLVDDKYSRQPSVSGSARSPNPSSTAKTTTASTTDPGKPQPRRHGPLSRSSRSTTIPLPTSATTSLDKASPSRSPLVERRSVDSTDSMDPAGYETYAHNSSSSNMPPSSRSNVSLRRMSSTQGDTIPVRLTPVTGRPSRAKKGVPVHTFTRAEHLRRHQLSHKPAAHQCNYPGCDKTFHRQDLLMRHVQRHEQEDRPGTDMTGSTSRRTSHTPVDRATGYLQAPMLPGNNLTIAEEMSTNMSYPSSAYSPSHRGSISGQGPVSPSTHSSPTISTGPSHPRDDYILSSGPHVPGFGIHPSMGSPFHPYGLEFEPRRSPSYAYISVEELPSLTIPDSSLPGHISQESNWPSSSGSNSPYSIPDKALIRGYDDSPSADVSNSYYVPAQYPSPQQHIYHSISDYNNSYTDDTGYYDFQSHPFPVRSPTPPIVALSAQPSENLVTVGPSVPDPPAVLGRHKGSAALLGPYSDAAFLTAWVPSTAALNAVPRYLDIYWKRFDPLFPLVHRRSVETSTDPILRCAIAAIGSQFLHSKEDRINSHILHGLASQEARRRPQWGIHVMQTILLCEFYGRFRGSRAANRASEPFQSLYSRDHLFSLVLSPSNKNWHQYSTSSSQVAAPQTSVDYDTPADSSHRHWDQWIVTESRRRLLAACFVLDVHTSMYHENFVLHHFLTPTPPIPLTKPSQYLWVAQDLGAWEALLSSDQAQLNAASLDDEEITSEHIHTAPPLDRAVYLASEALRLPRRSVATTMDLSAGPDLNTTERISSLFPGSLVASTYLALHYTPLRDLLAVSGDSWLFSRKLLDPGAFQQHKATVRLWSNSAHAGAASIFAAKALLAFFDTNDNTLNSPDSAGRDEHRAELTTSDISDYWALYVCALICWSLGHRTTRSAVRRDGNANDTTFSSGSPYTTNSASSKVGSEAKGWLKTVANWSPEAAIQNVRARRETLGVIAMVRRRLEGDTVGGKNKLLVDAVRVLKTLEEDPNRARF
ncbi:hypothetical protein F4825DRAFT_448321 [Nemania diffusa]|nr:hypothetical protein F4825DRAFT_448321 [Nemania diffusa]